MDGIEQDDADKSDDLAAEDKGHAYLEAVGGVSEYDCEAQSCGDRRNSVELGLDGAIAEALDDGWREVCEAVDGNKVGEVDDAANYVFKALEEC